MNEHEKITEVLKRHVEQEIHDTPGLFSCRQNGCGWTSPGSRVWPSIRQHQADEILKALAIDQVLPGPPYGASAAADA